VKVRKVAHRACRGWTSLAILYFASLASLALLSPTIARANSTPTCGGVGILSPDNVTIVDPANGGANCTFIPGGSLNLDGSVNPAADLGSPQGATTFSYDSVGRLVTETDALGNTSSYSYNTLNELTSDTVQGHTTTYTYDAAGRVVGQIDSLGNTTSYSYDAQNRLTSDISQGHTTSFTYDAAGELLTETDYLGNTTSYTYDAQNRLISDTAQGHTTTYTYDASGRLLSETDSLGNITRTTYDAAGQVTSDTDPQGHVTQYTYDAAGNVITAIDSQGTTHYVYTPGMFVPEPSTFSLLGIGLALLAKVRKRRQTA